MQEVAVRGIAELAARREPDGSVADVDAGALLVPGGVEGLGRERLSGDPEVASAGPPGRM
jgi:hypothetical protein